VRLATLIHRISEVGTAVLTLAEDACMVPGESPMMAHSGLSS